MKFRQTDISTGPIKVGQIRTATWKDGPYNYMVNVKIIGKTDTISVWDCKVVSKSLIFGNSIDPKFKIGEPVAFRTDRFNK